MKKLYLASKSPRRKALLQQLGFDFTVMPSEINESNCTGLSPGQRCVELAKMKASNVALQLNEGLVIGADTTVVFGEETLDKPKTQAEAHEMLSILSGSKHKVITGIAVVNAGDQVSLTDRSITEVWFRNLRSQEIEGYIKTGEPMDKAGAYGIQGYGSVFVDKIYGCYFNVVGLPVSLVIKMLEAFGLSFFDLTELN